MPAGFLAGTSTADDVHNSNGCKRKRRPAGTPDPDAEVVSLSAETLLESERYVCEICNQGFQRDQNLQMHRRRHKVPWKLVKSTSTTAGADQNNNNQGVRKRVYVCPEPSCLHHDPCHALGDLVGIKKHFRRKHSSHKQWACGRCSKAYAVQSDYKAHLKTCGTRGHSCDCGRVFSRVESFIEHQDTCNKNRAMKEPPSGIIVWPMLKITPPSEPPPPPPPLRRGYQLQHDRDPQPRRELQLLPTYPNPEPVDGGECKEDDDNNDNDNDDDYSTQLRLSIGLGTSHRDAQAAAEEARGRAKREVEMAEEEFSNAKRIRQEAQAELRKAMMAREESMRQISAMMLQITCNACKHQQQQL